MVLVVVTQVTVVLALVVQVLPLPVVHHPGVQMVLAPDHLAQVTQVTQMVSVERDQVQMMRECNLSWVCHILCQ